MSQLSLFTTDMVEPSPNEVAGVLAGRGQSTVGGDKARVTVLVDEQWRADVLVEQLQEAGLNARHRSIDDQGIELAGHHNAATGQRRLSVSTGWSTDVHAVVARWRRGAVATVPPGWLPGARELRAWFLSAGSVVGSDGSVEFAVGTELDRQDCRSEALQRALTSSGIANRIAGPRSNPVLQVRTKKARGRLSEFLGQRPHQVPPDSWPAPL